VIFLKDINNGKIDEYGMIILGGEKKWNKENL